MKQQEVFIKIGGILKELQDQYKYLETTTDSLDNIELDFFVANIQYLAQNVEMLRKLNEQTNKAKPAEPIKTEQAKETVKEKFFEPVVQQADTVKETNATLSDKDKLELTRKSSNGEPVPNIDITSETPADDYSFIRQEPEIIRHELEIDESWIDDEDEPLDEPHEGPVKAIPLQRVKADVIPVKPVIESKPHQKDDKDVITVNEKISAQIASKSTPDISAPPVTDLKSATNLNDKLLYIKDLFNGYSLAYNEVIEILNRLNSFNEAEQFLKTNYITKNNWESKPETVEKFYALLRRRYS
jgi:hypothetical protein